MAVAGTVLNAANLEPVKGMLVGLHCILIGILFHLRVDLFLGYLVDDVNQIAQCVIVALPAVFDLALYAVAVGNRHLAYGSARARHIVQRRVERRAI